MILFGGEKKQSGEGSVQEVGEQQAPASLAAQAPIRTWAFPDAGF